VILLFYHKNTERNWGKVEWHRLFGLVLTDYFTDSAYRVELEKDLSLKQQFLDVVIIEQESGKIVLEPPDGLENLARHNLLSYKSLRQSLDAWALDELVGHYVNYRKQKSPSFEKLLPAEDFRLYAVCTRKPQKLATAASLESLKKGIYEVLWGSQRIRIIVLSQVSKARRNAIWQLFSGIAEQVEYGADHYRWRRKNHSKLINKLYQRYRVEGIAMPYTWDDFEREYEQELLERLTPEERLKGLPPEERLKGLSPEVRLKGLPPEVRLKGLSAKEIEAYLKKLRKRKAKRLRKLHAAAQQIPLEANPATAHMFIVSPLSGVGIFSLFSTHPPMEKRIARLESMRLF
jgi:hypothetical protein